MTLRFSSARARCLSAGLIGGLAGGVAIDAFIVAAAAVLHGAPAAATAAGLYGSVAGIVLGHPGAPGPVWLGVLAHVAVSAAWGLGYGYLIEGRPQLVTRPWISGLAYGLLVWFLMQLVLMAGHAYRPPATSEALALTLIAHIVFFGLPVALVTAGRLRRA